MDTVVSTRTLDIDRLKNNCITIWKNTSETFPKHLKIIADSERAANQIRMKAFIGDTVRLIRSFDGKSGKDPVRWGSSLKKLIYDCGVDVAGLDGQGMKLLLNGGFCDVTSDFITEVRLFDAAFKLDDMLQSLRNVWIMNCIQMLMGMKVCITPSICAYSMLYPYTDNYLDAGTVPDIRKHSTNHRLEKRLAGERIKAETPLENRLFKLVDMIEGQYERKSYPMVYMSLLAIHEAQVRSMLQDGAISLTNDEILDISAQKGGSSVLADGCLIAGGLSEDEAEFIFSFGILLQLIDDLQDAAVDRSSRHNTLFTANKGDQNAECITNRLINFTVGLMDHDNRFSGTKAVQTKEVMKKSILLLIMGAAASNSGMYGKEYLQSLEKFSPVSFSCFRDSYRRIGREYAKLKVKLSMKALEVPMAKAFASGSIN